MGKFRALDYFDLYAPETLKQAHKNESVVIICLFFHITYARIFILKFLDTSCVFLKKKVSSLEKRVI